MSINKDLKEHWENIYQSKKLDEVSWYQPNPETSLKFLKEFNVPVDARIIDVGGGDSFLVDHLLEMGYKNISVLDISGKALERAKERLGEKGELINWIEADAADFKPKEKYDFWHDRAAFHFLTKEEQIENYIATVRDNLNPGGVFVLGTFSEEGPKKCSGIEIRQYSERSMSTLLEKYFEKIKCITIDHTTPFNTIQNFIFCSFRR